MGPALAGAMSNLSLRSQTRPAIPTAFCSAHRIGFSSLAGQRLFHSEATPVRCTASPSGFFVVAKQNAKQRQRLAEKQRQYNKSHKSAVGTRSKKVIKALADFNLRLPESEDDLKPVDVFLAEAYQEIDKAISKGILHKNTGARRKSKLAIARQKLLIKAGLYVPAATTA